MSLEAGEAEEADAAAQRAFRPSRPASAQRQHGKRAAMPAVTTQTDPVEAATAVGAGAGAGPGAAAIDTASLPHQSAAAGQPGPPERVLQPPAQRNQHAFRNIQLAAPPAAHWEEALSEVSVATALSRSQELTPPAAASRASMTGQLAGLQAGWAADTPPHAARGEDSTLSLSPPPMPSSQHQQWSAGLASAADSSRKPPPQPAPALRFYLGDPQTGSQQEERSMSATPVTGIAQTTAPANAASGKAVPPNVFVRMPPPPQPPRRNPCRHCAPAHGSAAPVVPSTGLLDAAAARRTGGAHAAARQPPQRATATSSCGSSSSGGGRSRHSAAALHRLAARRRCTSSEDSALRLHPDTADQGASPILVLSAQLGQPSAAPLPTECSTRPDVARPARQGAAAAARQHDPQPPGVAAAGVSHAVASVLIAVVPAPQLLARLPPAHAPTMKPDIPADASSLWAGQHLRLISPQHVGAAAAACSAAVGLPVHGSATAHQRPSPPMRNPEASERLLVKVRQFLSRFI